MDSIGNQLSNTRLFKDEAFSRNQILNFRLICEKTMF